MLAGRTEARGGLGRGWGGGGGGGQELGARSDRADDQALPPVKGEGRPEKWELGGAVVFAVGGGRRGERADGSWLLITQGRDSSISVLKRRSLKSMRTESREGIPRGGGP